MGLAFLLVALVPSPSLADNQGCAGTRKISQPIPYPVASAAATHEQQLDQVPRIPDVLLIGDSHAFLWPPDLWSPLQPVNTGIAGDLIEHVLWRLQDPRWRAMQPRNVVLVVGSNNLARGDCAFAILEGVGVLETQLQNLWPAAQLFLLGIPARARGGLLRPTERLLINAILERASPGRNVIYIDTDGIVDQLSPDQVHYVRRAYELLTSAILPRVK